MQLFSVPIIRFTGSWKCINLANKMRHWTYELCLMALYPVFVHIVLRRQKNEEYDTWYNGF